MPDTPGGREPDTHAHRITPAAFILFTVAVLAALIAVNLVELSPANVQAALGEHYYVAVGDSLSFGYQPNLNFNQGFADFIFSDLRKADVGSLANYACAGETTISMLDGSCPNRNLLKEPYNGPQLAAAIQFLSGHRGQVSPVTLEIGANDVVTDWNVTTCAPSPLAPGHLATMDKNLTERILPQLLAALDVAGGHTAGDLVLLNYYNVFARVCPSSVPFIHELNDHLAADAAQFRVPVVDVYTAFGGDDHTADTICQYTWYCNSLHDHDIHPTTKGYQVIAAAVESTLSYPGILPNPNRYTQPTPIPTTARIQPHDVSPMVG